MNIILAKQTELRKNIKAFLDKASEGNVVMVPRIGGKNVVIISEEEYKRLMTEVKK